MKTLALLAAFESACIIAALLVGGDQERAKYGMFLFYLVILASLIVVFYTVRKR